MVMSLLQNQYIKINIKFNAIWMHLWNKKHRHLLIGGAE